METKPKLKIPLTAVIASVVAIAAITGLFFTPSATTKTTPASVESAATSSNVKVEEYLETVEITAKGGYSPELSIAKANLPVVVKFNTDNTYDCSAVVAIPAMKYRAHLPMTGSTTVDLPPQQSGTEISGTCGMGMYNFKIRFAG